MSVPLSSQQFKHTADAHLHAAVRAGAEDPALHAEVARRGGLDYLDYHRSEWAKSPGKRDESKRVQPSVMDTLVALQRSQPTLHPSYPGDPEPKAGFR